MPLKPTPEQVQARLRIDAGTGLDAQLPDLIAQAHTEMLAFLDRNVYADAAAMAAAQDDTGVVITNDMVNAQILLVGTYLDAVGTTDGERMHAAAMRLLQYHRRMGA